MQDELKPCHFRQVDPHGRILCSVIKGGDREVSVQLCRACPVSQINCQNLRAGLEKQVSTPITVRFATGRVEVWDDTPPAINIKQAACAAKTMPIHSPRDCAGCPIRMPNVIPQNAIQVAHRSKPAAPAVAQTATIAQATPQRAPRTAQRVTQPAAQASAQDAVAQNVAAQAVASQPMARAAAQPSAKAQAAAARAQIAAHNAAMQAAAAQPDGIDMGMANDLIARAKATAERKAEEKRQRELERATLEQQQQQAQANAQPEAKPKIIQLQEWLAGQVVKKQNAAKGNSPYKPQAVQTDADGVSDIIYAPLGAQMSAAYQETIDYERCVGWTD